MSESQSISELWVILTMIFLQSSYVSSEKKNETQKGFPKSHT